MTIFPAFFLTDYTPGKCLLWYSKTKKRVSRLYKQEVQEVEKIDLFPKGLTHCFGRKMAIFQTFFFSQYRTGKCLLWYSKTKKRLSRLEKQEVQKVEKIDIFSRGLTHGFGRKMAVFQTFFFTQYRLGICILWYSRTKKCLSRL